MSNDKETPAANESGISLETHAVDEDLLKPLWIATTIANYPCAVCWTVFLLLVLMTYLDSLVFEYADNSDRTWLVEDNKYTKDYDAWTLAQDSVSSDYSDEDDTGTDLPQTVEQGGWTVFMMFEMENYDDDTNNWILTPSNLETIIKYEEMVTEDEQWKNYFCFVTDTNTYACDYFSLAQKIYDAFNQSYDSMTTSNIIAKVQEWHEMETYEASIEASFDPKFLDNLDKARMYRSFLSGGNPTPNSIENYTVGSMQYIQKTSEYADADDKYEKQETFYEDEFALDLWVDITVKHDAKLRDGDLRVVALIWAAYDAYAWLLVDAAFYFIGLAMLAVLVWMTVHLQSIWLSCLGVTGIMLSFPFAYFIYYYIYDVGYFDLLSSLIIFVLLGVGADDVFVFTDAWHQSVHFVKDPRNHVERMTFAYRRASKAMLVTQITTFFAFLATAFSQLLPVAAFGIWASTIVAADYFLVITMYPAVLMIHHKYIKNFEQKYMCCCCFNHCFGLCGKNNQNTTLVNDVSGKPTKTYKNEKIEQEIQMTAARTTSANEDEEDSNSDEPPRALSRQRSVEEQADEYRSIERFFGLKWTQLIVKIKYVVLLVFAVIFGVCCYLATGLEPLDESETWFAEDHYMQQILYLTQEFSVSEEDGLVDVSVIWGVKGVDRSGSNQWDPEDYGKVVWDDTFDMSSEDAQLFLYETCVNLSISDLVYQRSSVICPLNGFVNYTMSVNLSFPWTYMDPSDASYDASVQKAEFAELMYEFSQSEHASAVMADNLLYVKTPDQTDDGNYYIQYIAIYAYTDLSWDSTGSQSRNRRDTWIEWMEDTYYNNDACPDYVCKPIQASSMWAWTIAQYEFVRSALQGIAIAMPIAFLVLIISTHNWIVAIFATLDIVGIMACALAVMALMGWQFGISESLSVVIIIGFSVDYVVHFANAYLESQGESREERLSFSLLTMGVSVCSGAVTTFLAGFFMMFPEMQFFYKMGVIILATILSSIIWAMFFFTSLLAAFGPEGKTGNIPFDKIFERCKRKSSNESDSDSKEVR